MLRLSEAVSLENLYQCSTAEFPKTKKNKWWISIYFWKIFMENENEYEQSSIKTLPNRITELESVRKGVHVPQHRPHSARRWPRGRSAHVRASAYTSLGFWNRVCLHAFLLLLCVFVPESTYWHMTSMEMQRLLPLIYKFFFRFLQLIQATRV